MIKKGFETKECLTCGKRFAKKYDCSKKRWKKQKYCSYKCCISSLIWRKNIGISNKGKKLSDKTRRNIAKAKLSSKNPMWKGCNAGGSAIHIWVSQRLIRIKPKVCEKCGSTKFIDCASKSHNYIRDLRDWEWLCRRCHMKRDGRLIRFLKNCLGLKYRARKKENPVMAEFIKKQINNIYR